jgi:hypothetical protein
MDGEIKEPNTVTLEIGNYMLWDIDVDKFGITHRVTGEAGVFKKEDFLPYVSSFFGLNF